MSPIPTSTNRKIKVGVIANEFFEHTLGRMGGFGWAARQVALCFNSDPTLGVDVIFLTTEPSAIVGQHETVVHGTQLLFSKQEQAGYSYIIRPTDIDLLLAIDYRPNYRFLCSVLPHTPLIVWVRDPRPPEDVEKINTLRIPGAAGVRPQGIDPIDCTSLAGVVRASHRVHRPILFASPAPFLADKMAGAYGVDEAEVNFLPNIIDLNVGEVIKSESPCVVYLGRLDPIKRPWLCSELARRYPDVEFFFLGQAHFHGEGSWEPSQLPSNVRLMGHVNEAEKLCILASAWVLVNTSIHEGLPISFLEALACETPILSCQNPGGLVSRFGIYVGRWDGTGIEGIPHFAEGLHRLLCNGAMRARLGKEGRRWVTETHSRSGFLMAFNNLCTRIGVLPHQEAVMPVTGSSQSKERVVCIIAPYKDVYSQTFVRDHIKRLPTKVKVVDNADLSRGKHVLKQTFLESKVEAVLAEFGPTGVAVMEVTTEVGIPLIVHFHGYDAYEHRVLEQQAQSYPQLFRKAAAIIAVSRDMEHQLLRLGAPRQKLHYNPCGVDTSLFQGGDPIHAPPIFIAVGRFVAKKAPHLTLRAFKRVVEAIPEARLIMIGDGHLWEACKQLAKELGIVESVEFLGPCAHETVAATMRQARAFVQHSIRTNYGDSEGTPLTVVEAGATGLPVVATRHTGIEDVVVNGETGFLVDEGDVEGMAERMLQLGRDVPLAARLGRAAREWICAEFSMEKSIDILWRIIEATILAQGESLTSCAKTRRPVH
jgi:glycosyltransferase involved in cell wall biosynthesis